MMFAGGKRGGQVPSLHRSGHRREACRAKRTSRIVVRLHPATTAQTAVNARITLPANRSTFSIKPELDWDAVHSRNT
jgi:hypothetical protein